MFVSINHIPVAEGREADFEALWQSRERTVEQQPGFISLDILKPGLMMVRGQAPRKVDNVYHVMSRWESEAAFRAWIASDAFRQAHQRETDRTIYDGPAHVTLHETIEGAGAP